MHRMLQGHWEAPPYGPDALRSAYHVRALEVFRLAQLDPSKGIDVFLSHDWPANIARHGNVRQLCRAKPFLKAEVRAGLCISVCTALQRDCNLPLHSFVTAVW